MPLPTLPVVHDLLGRLYSDREWEELCSRCGACCYASKWVDGGWVATHEPCRLLDLQSKECRAYRERFSVEKDCIRVTPSVVLAGMMPKECSYVEELARIVEEDHGGVDPRQRWRERGRTRDRGRRKGR